MVHHVADMDDFRNQLRVSLYSLAQECLVATQDSSLLIALLWIRDVYPGSEFFHSGSRIRIFSFLDPY
jgi:hypothetical protein